MCVIQGGATRVADTQILAFKSSNGYHQVTAYSNRVDLPGDAATANASNMWSSFGLSLPIQQNAAMILPIPDGAKHFEMIDTSACKDMFERIDECFPTELSYSFTNSSRSLSVQSASLEVKTCGSYQYTLVPSLLDFARLDRNVFSLDADVHRVLAQYPNNFAFLVCKLSDSKKYHPVAYKHPLPRDGRLFVPTLHYHQGHHDSAVAPDWDHEIYLVTKQRLGKAAAYTAALMNVSAFRNLLPNVAADNFRKLEMSGNFPNQDLRVAA